MVLSAPLTIAAAFEAEIGASYFVFRGTQLGQTALSVDEPKELAPYIAGTYVVSDRFGVRLTYHHLRDVHTQADFGAPPGLPPSQPAGVFGHFEDDVHLLSVAPEFEWRA